MTLSDPNGFAKCFLKHETHLITNYIITNETNLIPHFLAVYEVNMAVNLALGKPTRQSSVQGVYYASKAVDGNKDSNLSHGSCFQARQQRKGWWRVYLEAVYDIREVAITIRGDCCSEF